MSQPEQPNKYEDLARQIREAGNATGEKQPHSGMESVPEDVREKPLQEFDNTPLERAFEEGKVDPANLPDHLGEIEPHDDDEKTIAEHAAKRAAEARSQHKSRRGLAALAGLVLTAGLGGGLFSLHHGGHEQDQPSQDPAAAATPNPGENNGPTIGTPEVNNLNHVVIDPSIQPDVAPKSKNQIALMEQKGIWPNEVDKALAADIPTGDFAKVVEPDYMQTMLDKYPNWDGLYTFYKQYVQNPNGIAEVMGSHGVVNSIYNETYAATSQLYGTAQQFKNPKTKDLVGLAPVISQAQLRGMLQAGNMLGVWNTLLPADRVSNLDAAYLNELKAGNNDPALIDTITNGILINTATGDREDAATTIRDNYQTLLQNYQQHPKAALEAYGNFNPGADASSVKVLSVVRSGVGMPTTLTDEGAADRAVTSAIVLVESTSDTGDVSETLNLVTFVAAPTKDGANQNVEMVILDTTSKPSN